MARWDIVDLNNERTNDCSRFKANYTSGIFRVRQRGDLLFFTYYGKKNVSIPDAFQGEILLGSKKMKQADVTIIKINK